MKAAVRTRYGPPDVVQISQVERPAPGDRELLVKVHATTVNRVVFAYPRLDQATAMHFAHLMETGQFTPVIDRQYPLDQIVDAYRYAETGQKESWPHAGAQRCGTRPGCETGKDRLMTDSPGKPQPGKPEPQAASIP